MLNLFKKAQNIVKINREKWFNKLTDLLERSSQGEDFWDEIEEVLITADVGVTTSSKLVEQVKGRVKKEGARDGLQIRGILKDELVKILQCSNDLNPIAGQNPRVILVVGANGGGKTTSIAKLAYYLKNEGQNVMLVAADTFRAAAIDQLKLWGERAGIDVIAHQPGSDPGAVVFDALQAAKNRNVNTLIIDTAGRLHTKYNLMEELKKIRRVITKIDSSAPHDILMVIDATTGQNGLVQAKYFSDAVGVTGIILTKLDSTAKGGIVLSICDELKIPICFIGTGEKMDDIAPFNTQSFIDALTSSDKELG